jgi:glucose-1-phosphate thymidylyltransferase
MSNRGEYELPDVIDLFIQSGRTIDTIRLDGCRIDVGFLENRDHTEERLDDITDADIDDQETEDEVVVDS